MGNLVNTGNLGNTAGVGDAADAVGAAKAGTRGGAASTGGKNLPALLSGLALLCLWQLGAKLAGIPHIIPAPTDVLLRLWELRSQLFTTHLPPTLTCVAIGFSLSVLLGVALAVLMDLDERIEAMLYPALVVVQTVPVMCIAPLFVLWFGYTIQARLLSIVLSTFFSITINTFDGLKSTKTELEELMQSFGATRADIFFRIRVPVALPNFMTSLKITFPWAVIGAAIAEWLGATQGLGYFSKRMVSKLDGSAVFAAVLLLSCIAVAGTSVIKLIDRKLVTWRNEI